MDDFDLERNIYRAKLSDANTYVIYRSPKDEGRNATFDNKLDEGGRVERLRRARDEMLTNISKERVPIGPILRGDKSKKSQTEEVVDSELEN
jgi:hypothetical protein